MARLGVQLLVYGERQREDLPGVLAEIHAAGFDGAEAGGDGRPLLPAATLLKAFQEAGLSLSALHVGYRDLADDALLAARLDLLQQAGGRYLLCSGVSNLETIAGYEQSSELFNEVGQRCREAGLTFCYHNHAWEFRRLEGGRQGIYTLLERTSPDLVKLAMDVFWLHIGGVVPAEFIARYADRAGYYHFKDGAGTPESQTFCPLGEGSVDLRAAAAAAMEHPVDWVVYEQDRVEGEPGVAVRKSGECLRALGL